MLCCLNPDCDREINPDNHTHCQNCGTPLVHLLYNRFKVIKPIGRGGFGKTYFAEDTHKLNEPCVVKQLAYQAQGTWAAKKAVELFEQEAKRLQQLGENPQIPALLAYFQEGGLLYLVQQFIEGQDLLKELQQRGEFSEAQVKQLLFDLLPVLQFTHERGIIHRDIKPPNIMRRYQDGKLILIDFGVSKLISQTTMGTGSVGSILGSYGYAPLEQMQDGKAVFASDLFALGVTCFNLLTGMSPTQLQTNYGYSWVSSWQQYLSNPISTQLKSVLDKLMQTDLQKRYQSASEVLKDLQSQTVPPTVPPPNPSPISPPTPLAQKLIGNVPPTPQPQKRSMFLPALIVGTGMATVAAVAMITNYPKAASQQPTPTSTPAATIATPTTIAATPTASPAIQVTAKELVEKGRDKSSKGNKQGAIEDFNQAIGIDSNYAEAYLERGLVRYSLGDKLGSIEDYTQAIRINPIHPNCACAYKHRGYVRSDLGYFKEAYEDFTQAIRLESKEPSNYEWRGFALTKIGNKQAAIDDYQKAADLYAQQGKSNERQKALDAINFLQQ